MWVRIQGVLQKKKIVLIFNFYKMNKSHSLQVAVVVIHVALVLIDSLRIDAFLEKKKEIGKNQIFAGSRQAYFFELINSCIT